MEGIELIGRGSEEGAAGGDGAGAGGAEGAGQREGEGGRRVATHGGTERHVESGAHGGSGQQRPEAARRHRSGSRQVLGEGTGIMIGRNETNFVSFIFEFFGGNLNFGEIKLGGVWM